MFIAWFLKKDTDHVYLQGKEFILDIVPGYALLDSERRQNLAKRGIHIPDPQPCDGVNDGVDNLRHSVRRSDVEGNGGRSRLTLNLTYVVVSLILILIVFDLFDVGDSDPQQSSFLLIDEGFHAAKEMRGETGEVQGTTDILLLDGFIQV